MNSNSFFDEEYLDISDAEIEFDLSAISAEPYFEYDNKRISCSFTGHRIITDNEKKGLLPSLKSTILYLVSQGVKEFHCGGAMGFDTLAASVVFDISRERPDIKLILELPYENQTGKWKENEKKYYEFLKSKANEVNIHANNPKNREEAVKALLSRNRILIDKSHYCVCYHKHEKGGTAYTVNYAKLHDVQIINLAE
ncbi:MAG: DUF1273 family protein [Clostridia bacterium]|nr:DUF1273 family protein [Clostridia bacterium]